MRTNSKKCGRLGIGLMACALTIGYASPPKPTVTTPVGPPPYEQAQSHGSGQLQVYSARESGNWGDVYQEEFLAGNFVDRSPEKAHSDYRIYNSAGKLVRRVRNAKNPDDAEPSLVTLPAGEYWVKAEAQDYGIVTLQVVIQPGEHTPVHLEKGWQPRTATADSGAIVRLAPHYPIGWRSAQGNAGGSHLTSNP